MEVRALFDAFDCDTQHREQAVFASLFILQNRMQTACEKLQTEISMKQWLLLAMAECCPPPRSLTRIGSLMGCSRQNVKKLAAALAAKGFVRLLPGGNNSLCVELTELARAYGRELEERHTETLRLLFADLSGEELRQLFRLYAKLYAGVERVEQYAAAHGGEARSTRE